MIWYKAHYGSWNDAHGVKSINFAPTGKYCFGTFSRKEAFCKAQETANETGKVVTVMWDIPRAGRGLEGHYKEVHPQV